MATPKKPRKPRREKLTSDEKRKAIEWAAAGMSYTGIACQLGYSSYQGLQRARRDDDVFNASITEAHDGYLQARAEAEAAKRAAITDEMLDNTHLAAQAVNVQLRAMVDGEDYDADKLVLAGRHVPKADTVMKGEDDDAVKVDVTVTVPDVVWVRSDGTQTKREADPPVGH